MTCSARGREVGKPAAEAWVSPARLASTGIGTWSWESRGEAMESGVSIEGEGLGMKGLWPILSTAGENLLMPLLLLCDV